MKLKIGTTESNKAFSLPESVAGQALAVIGIRGSGKTYGASKFAEELYRNGTQIVAIDPVGVWFGLRVGKDGKSKGLDITIFGGLHGDIPLQPTAGNLIADVIVSRNISAVIDVSQFESDADKARFARDFAARFFFLKKSSPSPVMVFVEESQEFIPQNPQKGEEQMLHAWQRMVRLGRNFQIGVTMISQRPQDVNKKALNQAEWVFAFKLQGTHERKAIAEWIQGKGLSATLIEALPNFPKGSAYIWGPEENISQVVKIGERITFPAGGQVSATRVKVEPKPLAESDLQKLRDSMSKQIEEAKANDPKELKAEVAKLKKELTQKSTVAPKASASNETVVSMAVNKAIAKRDRHWQSEIERLKKSLKDQYAKEHKVAMDFLIASVYDADKRWREAIINFQSSVQLPKLVEQAPSATHTTARVAGTPAVQVRPATVRPYSPTEGLDTQRQKILDTVAMLNIRGIQATSDRIARWMDLHPTGGRYRTNVASLRSEGYLDGCELTEKGAAAAREIPTGLEGAKSFGDGGKVTIIEYLDEHRDEKFTSDALARGLGLHPTGGRYRTNVARLRALGLVPSSGQIYLLEAAYL